MNPIDTLLQQDAILYTNLGKESTKAERESVRKQSRAIYKQIKLIDKETGELLLKQFD